MNHELARRAVACKHWRWMRGMSTAGDSIVVRPESDRRHGRGVMDIAHPCSDGLGYASTACLPNLDDPATVGCLLAIVREAWSAPDACPDAIVRGDSLEWTICAIRGDYFDNLSEPVPSEAEALVDALEAAP